MWVLPVLDLADGQVVHARGGQRRDYRPLRSPLCPSSRPEELAAALVERFAVPALYLADLDALEGGPVQSACLARLRAAVPETALWLDAGAGAPGPTIPGVDPVIGSESYNAVGPLEQALAKAGDRAILSLDFRHGRLLGPPAVLARPALWPQQILVMSLERVGAALGPDWARLHAVQRAAEGRRVFAAGGVRHGEDLRRLRDAGIAGVLVATALHEGSITAADLRAVA